MPPMRCAVTMAGLSSMVTVQAPSVACTTTTSTMALASAERCRLHSTKISTPSVPARYRCPISFQALASAWQSVISAGTGLP